MRSSRMALVILLILSCWTICVAQVTSIDLRKDGRVLTEARIEYFFRKISFGEFQISSLLLNKFSVIEKGELKAIIVPPGKTLLPDKTQGYVIGVVFGTATVPEDWPVTESDWRLLRDYSVNPKLAKAEGAYRKARKATRENRQEDAKTHGNELKASIENDEMAASYAGYLLLDDEATAQAADLTALAKKYRTKEIQTLHTLIMSAIREQRITWKTPIVVSDSDDMLSLKGLNFTDVDRQPGSSGYPGYVTGWVGSSLFIVVEKPDEPFTKKYGDLMGYLEKTNPTAINDAIRPSFPRPE